MSSFVDYQRLPRISLAKLYQSYKFSQNESASISQVNSRSHNDSIKIQSPFYQRHELSKGPCECAYHRMKRYKQIGIAQRHSVNTKMKNQINLYKSRIAQAVRCSCQVAKNKKFTIFNTNSIYKQKESQIQQLDTKLTQSRKHPKQRRIKYKLSLNNYNYLFQQILRKRMQALQDHEKVNGLIKYIKYKSNFEQKYLSKTKDYIYLHLLKLAQKISWDKIISASQNDPEMLKKIAEILNCKLLLASEVMKSIRKAVIDMQGQLLTTIKNRYSLQQNPKDKSKSLHTGVQGLLKQKLQFQIQNKNPSQLNSGTWSQNKENILQTDVTANWNKKLYLNDLGKRSLNERYHQSLLNSLSSSSRKRQNGNRYFSNINQIQNDYLLSNDKNFQQLKQQTILNAKVNQCDDKLSQMSENTNKKIHQSFITQKQGIRNRRSKFNQNNKNENAEYNDKNSKMYQNADYKDKKGKLHNKRKISKQIEAPCPFSQIKYEKIITNDQFQRIKHILTDNRKVITQQERVRKLFQYIQRRVSQNPQFFQQFLQNFQTILNAQQIAILKQKHDKYQFQKMIYKLTKQVDSCLQDLKNSQELVWKEYEQQLLKSDKNAPSINKTIDLECFQSNVGLIQQFNKFSIIQDYIPIEPISQENQLQQIEIGQIKLQECFPEKQIKFAHLENKLKKDKNKVRDKEQQISWKESQIDKDKHRAILKYIKSRYPIVFQQINQNIHQTLQYNNY